MFVMPETLDGLTVAELQTHVDAALDALRALGITEDTVDDELLAQGDVLMGNLDTLGAAIGAAEQAAADEAARKDRAKAIAQRSAPPAPQASDTPTAPPPQPEEPTPETPEPEQPDQVETPEGELVPVAASSTSPVRRAAAARVVDAPIAPRPRAGTANLTAAADVPGLTNGQPLDGLDEIGQALLSRMRGMPTHAVTAGVRQRYGAALVRFDGYDGLSQNDFNGDDVALVWAAGNEKRLPGGSLIAAGGWCAPSETLYDLCQYETVDGILSMPEFNVTRGGIRWTEGPSFADIYNACGFELTEEEAIAGTAEKTCCEVVCPPFDEIRLDAVGLCIRANLLTLSQYPELIRRFSEGAIVAHAHKVNARMLSTIAAAAGGGTTIANHGSIGVSLQQLELIGIHMRYQYRMSQTASIEVVAPYWLKALIRADRGLVAGADSDLTDAEINSWFSARNMAVQWVYDWQDLAGSLCTPTVPATATLLMYPAGTWVRGNADVINIDAVYDAASLAQNTYTATFMEQGILAVQKCTHTCRVVIETCVSGIRGALSLDACLTAVAPLTGTSTQPTHALAGTPGQFEPDSATLPATAAALIAQTPAVTAVPDSAWETGQYVQTATAGTGGRAYWNGSAWVAGTAP